MGMDEFEIAYYLEGQQLLLLLSLIDQKPITGLPQIESPKDWGQIALSLLQDARLRCEQDELVMDEALGRLLLDMKAAQCVYAIYSERPVTAGQVLYTGKRSVLLEFMPDGKYRLHQTDTGALRRLLETFPFAKGPVPKVLADTLPDNPAMKERLSDWESQAVTWVDSPMRWLQIGGVRCVLDCQTPELQARWIWLEDELTDIVLKQDKQVLRAQLDTDCQRILLLQELGLEG